MGGEERHEENEGQRERGRGRQRGYSRSGTYPRLSIVRPPPPPTPKITLASFIFAFSALDNEVTACRAMELLFEPEADDGFKWRVAGGVKHGLILCG